MNARHEVLAEESLAPITIRDGRVRDGYWVSAYDGIETSNPSNFDVDHLVPLAEAHHSGGWDWSSARRREFANDLTYEHHLIAVSATSNRTKSADDPAEWLPPNRNHLCDYLARWTTVKVRWQLSMDQAEHDTIARYADNDCSTTTISVTDL